MSIMPVITEITPPSGLQSGPDGRQAARAFSVIAASALEAEQIVLATKGVQRGVIYQSYTGETVDQLLKCQRINTTARGRGAPIGGVGEFIVTAEYARGGKFGSRRKVAEPGGPTVWRIERSETTEPVDHDVSGIPIANVVDEPIDPPLTRITHEETLVAEWYETAVDEITLYGKYRPYTDHVNSAVFRSYAIGCLLFIGADPKPEEDGLYLVTAKWNYRRPKTLPGVESYFKRIIEDGEVSVDSVVPPIEGWADVTIHRGRRILTNTDSDDPNSRFRVVVDADKKVVSEPVLLGTNGLRITGNGKPHAMVVYHYPRIDFAQMSIP